MGQNLCIANVYMHTKGCQPSVNLRAVRKNNRDLDFSIKSLNFICIRKIYPNCISQNWRNKYSEVGTSLL